jgi:hypothetical protein
MNCLECEDLFAAYIEGHLNDEQLAEFEDTSLIVDHARTR